MSDRNEERKEKFLRMIINYLVVSITLFLLTWESLDILDRMDQRMIDPDDDTWSRAEHPEVGERRGEVEEEHWTLPPASDWARVSQSRVLETLLMMIRSITGDWEWLQVVTVSGRAESGSDMVLVPVQTLSHTHAVSDNFPLYITT